MKYVRFLSQSGPQWGVVEGEQVKTLTCAPYEGVEYDGGSVKLADCSLLAPCTPTKIVCVGKNYAEHAREMGAEPPGFPVLFMKGLNALNSPGGEIEPPEFVQRLDYEGELAVVIRRRASKIRAEDYAQYVLGYTCLNDVTARDVQKSDGQWARGKNMDGFAPVGPVVTDEVDPASLDIRTLLNGEVVQQSNTRLLITSVPEIIAFITASMTLEPGDVIATGTPAGVGPMHPGDTVEVEIQGIGTLRSRIV